MKRVLLALTFATLAGALVFGAAASLEVGAANLGSGSSVVAACDTADDDTDSRDANGDGDIDHIEVDYTLDSDGDPTDVEHIIVSDISADCDLQTVYLHVDDGTTTGYSHSLQFVVGTHGTALQFTPATPLSSAGIVETAVTITGDAP